MAFDPKNNHIKEALSQTQPKPAVEETTEVPNTPLTINIPTQELSHEKKKTFTFPIKPSVREKLTKAARSRGYRSDAAFLEAVINSLDVE